MQSAKVVKAVQKVASVVAPQSFVATATGADYDLLHGIIRSFAHFAEFALLGALFGWCYRAYTSRKLFVYLPISMLLIVPIIDELLQGQTANRCAELKDVLIDTAGGICGLLFAFVSVWIVVSIIKKRAQRRLLMTPPPPMPYDGEGKKECYAER